MGVEVAPDWLDELHVRPGPPWHAMGTRALDERSWLLADDGRVDQLALKRALLDEVHDDVAASVPGAEAAAQETAQLIAAATGRVLEADRPPLEAAALLVQEDLCLLLPRDGGWRLDAGVVCFPSLWRISDKVGLPMTAVHAPVPAYDVELAGRVDRFLDRLPLDRPVWRRNWLVHDSPTLHQPSPPSTGGRASRHEPPVVPGGLWLRSERQTLRRLPRSGAILFTIRTQQAPFEVLTHRPAIAAAVARSMRSWSDDLVAYRSASPWRAPAMAWLDAVATPPVPVTPVPRER